MEDGCVELGYRRLGHLIPNHLIRFVGWTWLAAERFFNLMTRGRMGKYHGKIPNFNSCEEDACTIKTLMWILQQQIVPVYKTCLQGFSAGHPRLHRWLSLYNNYVHMQQGQVYTEATAEAVKHRNNCQYDLNQLGGLILENNCFENYFNELIVNKREEFHCIIIRKVGWNADSKPLSHYNGECGGQHTQRGDHGLYPCCSTQDGNYFSHWSVQRLLWPIQMDIICGGEWLKLCYLTKNALIYRDMSIRLHVQGEALPDKAHTSNEIQHCLYGEINWPNMIPVAKKYCTDSQTKTNSPRHRRKECNKKHNRHYPLDIKQVNISISVL